MTFLNPLVLVALAAAAIPLIVHLFNFRRPRRVDFSTLAFVQELQKSTMQRVRIKQWLLLLLRTLAIVFLILAFARPTMEGDVAGLTGGRSSSSVAVVVDTSPSMALRDAQGSYIEQAQEAAAAIVELMEQGDEVYVLGTGVEAERSPTRYQRRTPALEAIELLEVQPNAAPAEQALRRAAEVLDESDLPNRELYFISDLQESTLLDTLDAEAPAPIHTFLMPLGENDHENVAVEAVEVKSRIVETGQPAEIEATLVNYGNEPRADFTASLYFEGERVAQATADLEPELPTTVEFTAAPEARGWVEGYVAIEEDAFELDDRHHFSLHVPEERRVLLVEGSDQQADYVRLALTTQAREDGALFEVDAISETALAGTRLADYDAVVLVGPQDVSSGEIRSLTQYMENGGGVMLFPTASAESEAYNAFLEAIGGGSVSGFSGSVGAEQPMAGFDRVDLEHPLFEGIFNGGTGSSEERVESPDVFHAMNYQPGDGAENTLVELSNGFPFLQEIRHGGGTLLLATSAPDPGWSDLPVRGLFVPLMVRAAHYLGAGESVQGEAFALGQPAELRLTGSAEGATLQVQTPEGEAFIPEQRRLTGATLLELEPSISTPGLYEIREGEQLHRKVAFNPDSRHSNLDVLEPEEAADELGDVLETTVDLLEAGGAEEVTRTLTAQRTGTELWNVFLLLALVLLVAEMIVARRWQPESA